MVDKIRLGRTNLYVTKLGMGGVPLQRLFEDDAVKLVSKCIDLGINFLDTAAEYPVGEKPIGKAIRGCRSDIILSTKGSGSKSEISNKLNASLEKLGVDYIDLYQFHDVSTFEDLRHYTDPAGPLSVIRDAMKAGIIRHFGITSHNMEVAIPALKSGLFETIMFPFNFVTNEPAVDLLPICRRNDIGFIAMKPFAGGRIDNPKIALKYLFQFPDVISIPGVQKFSEMEENVKILEDTPYMTTAEQIEMETLKGQMDSQLCRRCRRCEPCPQQIPVVQAVDLMPFIINMPHDYVYSESIAETLDVIKRCDRCGECEKKCPWGLPIMDIIKHNLDVYSTGRKQYLVEFCQ